MFKIADGNETFEGAAMSNLLGVSVVISTFSTERLEYVSRCIESIGRQSVRPIEVILVVDPDQELIDFYEERLPQDTKIIASGLAGLSNARNTGIRVARGSVLAFIDDDAIADVDWLKELIANYEEPEVIGVGGLALPVWAAGRPAWFPEELDWIVGCSYMGLPHTNASIRSPLGCNMSFRNEVFRTVGYFDSNLGRIGRKLRAGEEAEFCLRALSGIPRSKIVFAPSAIVYHRVPPSRAKLLYVAERSIYEGISKAAIRNAVPASLDTLSTERTYLKYLFRWAIPTRFKQVYQPKKLSQLLVIICSMACVFAGYFEGRAYELLSPKKHVAPQGGDAH